MYSLRTMSMKFTDLLLPYKQIEKPPRHLFTVKKIVFKHLIWTFILSGSRFMLKATLEGTRKDENFSKVFELFLDPFFFAFIRLDVVKISAKKKSFDEIESKSDQINIFLFRVYHSFFVLNN